MMRFVFALFALVLVFSRCAMATEISDADVGTYEWLNRQGEPFGVLYKLARSNDGKWVAEGFIPGKGWRNVSCDTGCEYRTSTAGEIEKYFSAKWVERADIACIQNIAQAFCRYTGKKDTRENGYVIFALVSGEPIPVMVRKVSRN